MTEIPSAARAANDAGAEGVVRRMFAGLRVQSVAALALAAMSLLVSPVASYSSLFGSLAVYLPGLVFTIMVSRRVGGPSPAFLRTVMLGEFGKLFLVGALCATVFIFVEPLHPGWFFAGMITVLAASWVGLAMAFRGAPGNG